MKDRRVRKRGRRADDQLTRLVDVPYAGAPAFATISATHGDRTVKLPFFSEAGRRAAEKVAAEFERTGEVPQRVATDG